MTSLAEGFGGNAIGISRFVLFLCIEFYANFSRQEGSTEGKFRHKRCHVVVMFSMFDLD